MGSLQTSLLMLNNFELTVWIVFHWNHLKTIGYWFEGMGFDWCAWICLMFGVEVWRWSLWKISSIMEWYLQNQISYYPLNFGYSFLRLLIQLLKISKCYQFMFLCHSVLVTSVPFLKTVFDNFFCSHLNVSNQKFARLFLQLYSNILHNVIILK